MIEQALFSELQAAIVQLDKNIAETKQRFDREDDSEESQLLRVRLTAMTKLRKSVADARNGIVVASLAVDEVEKKFRRWRELCRQAREAREKMEAVAKLVEPARSFVSPAHDKVLALRDALANGKCVQAEISGPGRYATVPEIRRAAQAVEKLQVEFDNAVAHLGSLKQRVSEVENQWLSLRGEFDAAVFAERMARLPDEQFQNQEIFAAAG